MGVPDRDRGCCRPLWLDRGVAVAMSGCGTQNDSLGQPSGSSINVSEATLRDGEWPFTVPRGILGCTDPQTVTFNVNGTLYGINGTAIDHGYQPIDPIWKLASPGPRVSLGSVIEKGLSLCTHRVGHSSSGVGVQVEAGDEAPMRRAGFLPS